MKLKVNRKWKVSAHIAMGIMSFFAIIPFVLLIISSFTDENAALRNGYSFFPEKFSLGAYSYLLTQWQTLGRGYLVTIEVTVIGTVVGVTITALIAYVLSRKELPGRRILLFIVVFIMLFNGGLTATYIIYTQIFHIKNTIFGLIVPGLLVNGYFIMMFRNYFENSIPSALLEAAKIDGAGEMTIFFKIVVPLSLPMVATVALPVALMYWNDWMNGMYYLTPDSKLQSIQTILNNMNENINFLKNNAQLATGINVADIPSTTIRMAIAVVGILPILVMFPFIQNWFVRGVTVGAVKE